MLFPFVWKRWTRDRIGFRKMVQLAGSENARSKIIRWSTPAGKAIALSRTTRVLMSPALTWNWTDMQWVGNCNNVWDTYSNQEAAFSFCHEWLTLSWRRRKIVHLVHLWISMMSQPLCMTFYRESNIHRMIETTFLVMANALKRSIEVVTSPEDLKKASSKWRWTPAFRGGHYEIIAMMIWGNEMIHSLRRPSRTRLDWNQDIHVTRLNETEEESMHG